MEATEEEGERPYDSLGNRANSPSVTRLLLRVHEIITNTRLALMKSVKGVSLVESNESAYW